MRDLHGDDWEIDLHAAVENDIDSDDEEEEATASEIQAGNMDLQACTTGEFPNPGAAARSASPGSGDYERSPGSGVDSSWKSSVPYTPVGLRTRTIRHLTLRRRACSTTTTDFDVKFSRHN